MSRFSSLIAMSDALLAASGGGESVLIAQYDIFRDECVYRWSCDDRSIGFRWGAGEMSPRDLAELIRTWRESELVPGSTAETAEKAKQLGPDTNVVWANFRE